MAYNPTTWKDQIVTDPTKYKITKENGTEEVVNIEKVPGEIIQEGTRITADKLNNIEEGIKGAADLVGDLAGEGRTGETVKKNANDIASLSTQMAEFAEEIENHIGSRGDSHGLATTSSHGFMSNVDKIRLNSTLTSTSDVYITGTYTGNGSSSQFINVGFTPSAIIVTRESGDMGVYPSNSGIYEGYGGLALNGHPIVYGGRNVIKISTNGFYAYYLDDNNHDIYANDNGEKFHYIAFK